MDRNKLTKYPVIILGLTTLTGAFVAILARDSKSFRINNMLQTRHQSIKLAFATLPSREAWWRCLALALVYGVVAWLTGVLMGFIRFHILKSTWRESVSVALALFVHPGILEELVFRVLLLPHPKEGVSFKRTLVGATASLVAFVLTHPVNGMTFSPRARSLFSDLAFLFQASLLGIVCTAVYLISGSIWPAVFLHWLPVTIWILFFGGAKRLARSKYWT